jgi:hypothetical protein
LSDQREPVAISFARVVLVLDVLVGAALLAIHLGALSGMHMWRFDTAAIIQAPVFFGAALLNIVAMLSCADAAGLSGDRRLTAKGMWRLGPRGKLAAASGMAYFFLTFIRAATTPRSARDPDFETATNTGCQFGMLLMFSCMTFGVFLYSQDLIATWRTRPPSGAGS